MRLITFGDSWTAGHGVETTVRFKETIDCGEFTNFLRQANGWPKLLANHLGEIPFVNLGVCGDGNLQIIEKIRTNLENLLPNDLIVVMLSHPYRSGGEPLRDIPEIYKLLEGRNYRIISSFYPTFKDVPESLKFTLINSNFILPENAFSQFLIEYESKNDVSVWEYGSRKVMNQNTFDVGDYHPNYEGYKILAWEIFNRI